ncbi:MAG: hypothetical protein KatS3mg068_1567 [Candidatus Sericytochromatia bacterium]|nr:MAG: hypothetical protein KatS3mg068_1567 [Candidatus Sericytochromatia bacterium]
MNNSIVLTSLEFIHIFSVVLYLLFIFSFSLIKNVLGLKLKYNIKEFIYINSVIIGATQDVVLNVPPVFYLLFYLSVLMDLTKIKNTKGHNKYFLIIIELLSISVIVINFFLDFKIIYLLLIFTKIIILTYIFTYIKEMKFIFLIFFILTIILNLIEIINLNNVIFYIFDTILNFYCCFLLYKLIKVYIIFIDILED